MQIMGLQRLTALDYPDRLACTVFTPSCSLRCPFCHNASLVYKNGEEIDENEVLSFLDKRKGLLDGVCITGGEPLLQSDIVRFAERIKEKGFLVKLDTNGAFPDKLEEIIGTGLVDYVAMDVKNSPEKYAATCGFPEKDSQEFFEPFKKSIDILLESRVEYEFRTTVVRELHSVSDIEKIGREINGAQKWFLQCFKDSGDLIGENLSEPHRDELEKMEIVAQKFAEHCEIRGI